MRSRGPQSPGIDTPPVWSSITGHAGAGTNTIAVADSAADSISLEGRHFRFH